MLSFDGVLLHRVTALQLRTFASKLTEAGLSPSVRQHTHDFINGALKDALRVDLLERNPMEAVDRPRDGRVRERPIWTAEQVLKILEAAKGHALEHLFGVTFTLGLRIGETCGLQWRDFKTDALEIQRTVNRAKDGGPFRPPKSGSRRTLALDPATVQVLEVQRLRMKEARLLAFEAGIWSEHDLIFPSSVGTPLNPQNVARVIRILCGRADVPVYSSHAMRRTYISLVAPLLPPREIADRVGHSDMRMTLEVYTQVLASRKTKSAIPLSTLLTPELTPTGV
jgi:integrase